MMTVEVLQWRGMAVDSLSEWLDRRLPTVTEINTEACPANLLGRRSGPWTAVRPKIFRLEALTTARTHADGHP